jgi:hypothetical protein
VSAIAPYAEPTLDQIAQFIAEENRLCGRAVQDALAHARACGKWLWLAYDRLKGTGRWLAWLTEATELSQPTAWRYMKLERESREGGRLFTLNNVPMAEALALLAAPDDSPGLYEWAEDPADEPPPADADRLRDPAGLVIPDRLLAVFALSAVWDEAALRLRQAVALIEKLSAGPGGEKLDLVDVLSNCLSEFPHVRPYASACPICQVAAHDLPAPHCPYCQGRGWLSRSQWDAVPATARARLLAPPTED